MEDCKPMAIPLVSNWRKIDASGSDRFDPTLYCVITYIVAGLPYSIFQIQYTFSARSPTDEMSIYDGSLLYLWTIVLYHAVTES